MSKIFRCVSTVMIAVGLIFLFIYTWFQGSDKLSVLDQPSYYAVQNYWLMFVAGIVVIAFSVLGSFFSWFKKMDPPKESLPNAGYASAQDIHTWVSGSDTAGDATEVIPAAPESGRAEALVEATELLPEKQGPAVHDGETEVLREEDVR